MSSIWSIWLLYRPHYWLSLQKGKDIIVVYEDHKIVNMHFAVSNDTGPMLLTDGAA